MQDFQSKVEETDGEARLRKKRYFWNAIPRVLSSQVPQRTLVLNFLVVESERHISLGANTAGDGHKPISVFQPILDPGADRSDSSDVAPI